MTRGQDRSPVEDGAAIIAEAFASYDRAMRAVAAGQAGPVTTGVICCAVISDAIMAHDLERAEQWTDVLDRWCRAQPSLVTFSGQRHALQAALQLAHGEWDDAAVSLEHALARFRAGDYRANYGAPYHSARNSSHRPSRT